MFDRLDRRIVGAVIPRSSLRYESARRDLVWQQSVPDRSPAAIVRVAHTDDVARTVRFAAEEGLRVTVRGGGHHWSAPALLDDVLVLDLSDLDRVLAINTRAKTASCQPLVRNAELIRQLAPHRLAFPVGHCSSVPLSGFLLGGGFGWNTGGWGVACWSIRDLDVITPTGDTLRVGADAHEDLFWAARGAGPAFPGVVTRYGLRLVDLPRAITTRTVVYPLQRAVEVAAWLQGALAQLPPWVELTLLLAHVDGRPACVVSAVAFAESPREASAALALLAACPVPGALSVDSGPATFGDLFGALDPWFPRQARYAVDTTWSTAPPTDLLATVAAHVARAPSPRSLCLCLLLPPGAPTLPPGAFSMIAPAFVASYAIWDDPADAPLNRAWLEDLSAALAPSADGHYVGEADLRASPDKLARCFDPEAWRRLEALRTRWDPLGTFARVDRTRASVV